MSKSLQLSNGDLILGAGRSLGLVSGKDKLLQDLSLWVLERIGVDPATPSYGNLLDGGIVNDTEIPGFIGEIVGQNILNEIRNEVLDILQRYQAMQYEKIRRETLAYIGLNTLDEDEVLQNINSVKVTSVGTTVLVQVIITTLAGSNVKLTIPIAEGVS